MSNNIDFNALMQIKACKDKLTAQQYRTLKGQVLSGNSEGALKGLKRLIENGC